MQTTQRRFKPAVIERLFAEPYRFEYFQAVRMLQLWLKRHGSAEQGMVENFLRFQNSTRLSFPASEIEAIATEPREVRRDARALGAALRAGTLRYVRVTPTFMGLTGGNGALPAHYTERIAAHILYEKDEGPRAFLDTFSNRSLALFYAAWSKYRLELKYQVDGKDGFLPLLLSLAGLGNQSLRKRLADDTGGGVRDESMGFFAAAMRQRPASASQIARVLADYFNVPFTAEQFIGCWYDVPREQQTMLGGDNAVLGAGALSGARVWQRDLRLRLVIGPLARINFDAFLPGAVAARALKSLLTMLTGVSLEYEVQLVLRAEDVTGAVLAEPRSDGRLGWDTFLVTGAQTIDRADVRYDIHAIAAH